MQEGGVTKEIIIQRDNICSSCNGTREAEGSQSITCYSCGGEGIKEDALFHKKVKCNTCKGHGKLVQNPCRTCDGTGLQTKEEKVTVVIDRFTQDGETIELPLQGHRTLYPDKGKNGSLKILVKVEKEKQRWRSGIDVHSKHYVPLSDALQGCKLNIDTVHGIEEVSINKLLD